MSSFYALRRFRFGLSISSILILWSAAFIFIEEAGSYEIKNMDQCMKYLKRFGYMENADGNSRVHSGSSYMKKSIQEFQAMMRLNMTGKLDEATMNLMNKKRCGNPDKGPNMVFVKNKNNREKRYVLEEHGRVWRKRFITYKITQHSQNKHLRSHRKMIYQFVEKAFGIWAAAADLKFFYASDLAVDIEIKFLSAKHDEDEYAFDGPGNTLAHAFPPGNGLGGDVHFDDQEMWDIIKDNNGSNFFWVALHELGHALGLAHSPEPGSIMQPFSMDFDLDLQLHADDIAAIQNLYGPPSFNPWPDYATVPSFDIDEEDELVLDVRSVVETVSSTSRPAIFWESKDTDACDSFIKIERHPQLDPCTCPQMDAITTISNGQTYVFKGWYAYRVDRKSGLLLTSDSHRIEYIFEGLKDHDVDAALTTKDGRTYVFKEGKVWSMHKSFLQSDKPSEFSQTFPNYPFNTMDAGFEWEDQIYFIKGKQVFVSEVNSKQFLLSQPISNWGVTDHKIDAAFVAPTGKIYLFHKDHFWTLTPNSNRDLQVEPPLPQNTQISFLHCSQSSSSS